MEKYDVIIIGAGIGGLVSGCYLAKFGFKVLIIEKNSQVGGYCVSFKRKKFNFDAGVHVLTTFGVKGVLNEIFNELEIDSKQNIIRVDPSDIIITPDIEVQFYNDINKTISLLQKKFPFDANGIHDFFSLVKSFSFSTMYAKYRNKTFYDILKEHFTDFKLREIMSCFLGVMGIPAHKVSAHSGLVLYQKYLCDGGYYFKGGAGRFANLLAKKFINLGGTLFLSCEVTKIGLKGGRAKRVIFHSKKEMNEIEIMAKSVVSDVDVRNTFLKFIDSATIKNKFGKIANHMIPSPSAFIVYLGVSNLIRDSLKKCCGLWFTADYNINSFFSKVFMGNVACNENKFLYTSPTLFDSSIAPTNCDIINLIVPMPFKTRIYWEKNKEQMSEVLLEKAQRVIPNLKKSIIVKECATPQTFFRFTNNYKGSIRGWANTVSQTGLNLFPIKTFVDDLYLVSHWTTFPGIGGVASVAYSGRQLAKFLQKNNK